MYIQYITLKRFGHGNNSFSIFIKTNNKKNYLDLIQVFVEYITLYSIFLLR